MTTEPVDPLETPTGRAVTEVLAPGEPLLDVGCGGGRIAAAFTPAHPVLGVEAKAAYAEHAAAAGVQVTVGRWPDVAREVPVVPVVLCTHVLYDVQDAGPFAAALAAHADRRVVIELTTAHPWVAIAPLFKELHDLELPSGPTVEYAIALLEEVGLTVVQVVRWTRPGHVYPSVADLVAHRRRQLCLPADRDDDVRRALTGTYALTSDGGAELPPSALATLVCDPR